MGCSQRDVLSQAVLTGVAVFAEYRRPEAASSPEFWSANLTSQRRARPLTQFRRWAYRTDPRWKLIKRWAHPEGPILDAGCGAGEWVAFLASQGRAAQGLDYSTDLIARNRALYSDLSWDVGDVEDLPYEDSVFAAVVSWGVVEHRHHGPLPALREFARVLRVGGAAIVTVPVDSAGAQRTSKAGDEGPGDPGSAKEFFQYYMTTTELRDFVAGAGLIPVDSGTIPIASFAMVAPRTYLRLNAPMRYVAQMLTRIFLSGMSRYRNMTYVVGRKP